MPRPIRTFGDLGSRTSAAAALPGAAVAGEQARARVIGRLRLAEAGARCRSAMGSGLLPGPRIEEE